MADSTSLSRRTVGAGLLGAALAPAAACGQAGPTAAPAPETIPKITASDLGEAVTRGQGLPQLRSMIVAQDGAVVLERVFRGPGLAVATNIKSASKTVLSALVGAAIDRGVLKGLDQPIGPILGSRIPAAADPRVKDITVENLVTMASGLESTSGRNYGRWVTSRNWTSFALSRPFVAEPGGRMIYSTGTSHILSAVLSTAAGRSTLALAQDWLGKPLGITVPPWPRSPEGVYFGGNDMLLSPRALLRFGELYRNGGTHEGTRVLSRAWVEDSWKSRGGRSPFTGFTYGLGWWLRSASGRPVYFAWGYGGQMVFVVPSLAMTVVMTSDSAARERDGHVQALHALLDDAIVGAAARA